MGFEEFNLGRDQDEMAMAMNRKPLKEFVKDLLAKLLWQKGTNIQAVIEEEGIKEELPETV